MSAVVLFFRLEGTSRAFKLQFAFHIDAKECPQEQHSQDDAENAEGIGHSIRHADNAQSVAQSFRAARHLCPCLRCGAKGGRVGDGPTEQARRLRNGKAEAFPAEYGHEQSENNNEHSHEIQAQALVAQGFQKARPNLHAYGEHKEDEPEFPREDQ